MQRVLFERASVLPCRLGARYGESKRLLCVRSAPHRRASPPPCSCHRRRVPRILFFGGDIVSVTALHAICTRLSSIFSGLPVTDAKPNGSCDARDKFLARHVTVVAPSLPAGLGPGAAHARFSRQFPVVRYAMQRGIPLHVVDHPTSLTRSDLLKAMLHAQDSTTPESGAGSETPVPFPPLHTFDVSLVVSFRYFLPKKLLRALPSPVLNLHPSLLPRYRGASPIFSTLRREQLDGEARPGRGGVTIAELSADQPVMDGGRILWQREIPLEPHIDLRTYFPLATQVGAAGCCEVIFGAGEAAACSSLSREVKTGAADSAPDSPATSITSEVIEAVKAHYYRRPGVCEAVEGNTKPVLPTKAQAGMPAHSRTTTEEGGQWVSLFPSAISSPLCDWPATFTRYTQLAVPQEYPVFPHFSEDPYHAPLLPRDAAMLQFHRMTGREAFNTWRAFAGAGCFISTVNTIMHKLGSPAGETHLLRLLRRALNKWEKRRGKCGAVTNEEKVQYLDVSQTAGVGALVEGLQVRLSTSESAAEVVRRACEDATLHPACTFIEAVPESCLPAAVLAEMRTLEQGCLKDGNAVVFVPRWSTLGLLHSGVGGEAARPARSGDPPPLLIDPISSSLPLLPTTLSTFAMQCERECLTSRNVEECSLNPGDAYFPHADPSLGAIKCRTGWFFWRAAHLTGSPTRSQPVELLRKGLAMRCGIVYPELFVSPPPIGHSKPLQKTKKNN